MKKLCLLIPTYNRPDYVKEWLETTMEAIRKYDFDVHLFDSSTNKLTENVIKQFYEPRVFYHYFQSDDNSPDMKVRYALEYLQDQYEYIWLCGDGVIVNFINVFDFFGDIFQHENQIIHLCDFGLNINKIELDNNCNTNIDYLDFTLNFLHSVTLYGSTIISNSFLKKLVDETDFTQWRSSYFYPQLAMIALLDHNTRIAVYLGKFFESSKTKLENGNLIQLQKKQLYIWVQKWKNAVDLLPARYNAIKEKLYKSNFVFFTWGSLIVLRINNNLPFRQVKAYWKNLKFVIQGSRSRVLVVSIVPKFLWKIIYRLHERGNKTS